MRVAKWGNSLAVRLPKRLVNQMGLVAGEEVNLVPAEDRTIAVEKDRRREQALERLASMRLTLPPDYKFDREEANER
jgi:antitoxin MazE